jgi:hypothetical protein
MGRVKIGELGHGSVLLVHSLNQDAGAMSGEDG